MANVLDIVLSEEDKTEIKDMVLTLLVLPKEDRTILMSNAQILKARYELAKARKDSA